MAKFNKITKYALILAMLAILFTVFFSTSGQTADFFYSARVAAYGKITTQPAGAMLGPQTFQVPLPLSVTSGGNAGWDDCASIDGGVAAVKTFCVCKGYADVYNSGTKACYKMNSVARWQWTITQRPFCAAKSENDKRYIGYGLATIQVKCI